MSTIRHGQPKPKPPSRPRPQLSIASSLHRRHPAPRPSPSSSPSDTHSGISSIAHLDRGTKIGIIVGITVIAILVVIGCGLAALGFRRRRQRRRRRRLHARDEELAVLEGELKTGRGDGQMRVPSPTHTHKRQQDSGGLWDNLKVRYAEGERSPARGMQRLGKGRDGRREEGSGDGSSEVDAGFVKPVLPPAAAAHLLPPSSVAVSGSHT